MSATYRVQIGFSAGKFANIFTIGSSLLDSTAGFGHEFLGGYGGPYDDVTSSTVNFKTVRGRAGKSEQVAAGRLECKVLDGDKIYNPRNVASPIYGEVVPMIPGMVEVEVGGIWYSIFHGWLDEEQSFLDLGDKSASFVFLDMLTWFNRNWPVIAATGVTTTGAAIGLILDSILWPSSLRSLQVGDNIPDFSADGTAKASDLVSGLLEAERGLFFASRNGIATYTDRHNADRISPVGSLSVTSGSVPGTSASNVRNRARVTREGGVQQTWEDAASVNRYGYSDWGETTTPYLNTDSDALYLAKELVRQGKDPISNMWSFETEGVDDATLALLAALDQQEKLTIAEPDVGGDYLVEQISHSGAGGEWLKSSLILSDVAAVLGFRIGIDTLDGAEVLVY